MNATCCVTLGAVSVAYKSPFVKDVVKHEKRLQAGCATSA
jgi:hypothetical protein